MQGYHVIFRILSLRMKPAPIGVPETDFIIISSISIGNFEFLSDTLSLAPFVIYMYYKLIEVNFRISIGLFSIGLHFYRISVRILGRFLPSMEVFLLLKKTFFCRIVTTPLNGGHGRANLDLDHFGGLCTTHFR